MTSLEHLLPEPDAVVRCADHGRRIGLDPGGTAIRADRFVVIDTPLPWPKPVFAHPLLEGVRDVVMAGPVTTRVLAAVPSGPAGAAGAASEAVLVAVYDRAPGDAATEWQITVEPQDLSGLAAALAATPVGERPAFQPSSTSDAGPGSGFGPEPRPLDHAVVLVCTQGSHDVCCGSDGARFAAEVEAMPADVTVRRVSHTGGHRFAPTLVTLPDGRMWADADIDLLRQVLRRTGEPAEVVDRCRGWWGADTGPAQVAERAVLAAAGWEVESLPRAVVVADADTHADADTPADGDTNGGGSIRCVVTAGARTWDVSVSAGREVPTIGCRVPGGLPAKTHTEHRVESLVERT